MGTIQIKNKISELDRRDFYEENEVKKIADAQHARSAQAMPTVTFAGNNEDEPSATKIYIYGLTSKDDIRVDKETKRIPVLEEIEGVSEAYLVGKADFYDAAYGDYEDYGKNRFSNYEPIISGSIKLTFEKKRS